MTTDCQQAVNTFTFYPTVYGVTLEAKIYHEPGEKETRDEPGEPPLFECHEVWLGGTEIFDLLHPNVIESLDTQAANYQGEPI